jgi:adenylate cyclase
MVTLLWAALAAKLHVGEVAEALRLAQCLIDLADGDPDIGNLIIESPLAVAILMRGVARACLGHAGWKDDIEDGLAMARVSAPMGHPVLLNYKYGLAIPNRALLPGAAALLETAEALEFGEHRGDDYAVASAQFVRGIVLVQLDGDERHDGFDLLAKAGEAASQGRFAMSVLPQINIELAKDRARTGDHDGAIALLRAVVDSEFDSGEMFFRAATVSALVDALLQRGTDADVQEAQAAVERFAAVPTEAGFILHELPLLRLRALLARSRCDEISYRDFAKRYRAMAISVGFEGHIACAEAMT